MRAINTKFKGLKIIKQKNNTDRRGSLRETHNQKVVKDRKFIFEYCTTSKKNVFRGFHIQTKYKQAKYVNVIKGKIIDYVIDLRNKSNTYGKVFKIALSDKNCLSLYIPEGFAHGYFSCEKINIIYYKLSNYYKPKFEDGIIWNDIDLNIKYPIKNPSISKKDKNLKTFKNFCKFYKNL